MSTNNTCKEAGVGAQIPGRHKPVHGGCGKNFLFFTPLHLRSNSCLHQQIVAIVTHRRMRPGLAGRRMAVAGCAQRPFAV